MFFLVLRLALSEVRLFGRCSVFAADSSSPRQPLSRSLSHQRVSNVVYLEKWPVFVAVACRVDNLLGFVFDVLKNDVRTPGGRPSIHSFVRPMSESRKGIYKSLVQNSVQLQPRVLERLVG